jgi:hypothetical protein
LRFDIQLGIYGLLLLDLPALWHLYPLLLLLPLTQRLRQLHVHIHPDRLRDARLTQDEIIAAAKK